MNYYIGTKLIKAEPMTEDDFKLEKDGKLDHIPSKEPSRKGYKVKYSDDYESWSPKEVFEEAYIQVDSNTNENSLVEKIKDRVKQLFIKIK